MRYLGLDLGSVTLGVAISDTTNTIASSYKTIRFKENDYVNALKSLKPIIEENKITHIILGLPKNMNNTIGKRAEITINFKKQIEDEYHVQVILNDERLTTVMSNDVLITANVSRKKRKKVVDSLAAIIILQSYLDKEKKERND